MSNSVLDFLSHNIRTAGIDKDHLVLCVLYTPLQDPFSEFLMTQNEEIYGFVTIIQKETHSRFRSYP